VVQPPKSRSDLRQRWAEVTLPAWLYGGNLDGFAAAAGWQWERNARRPDSARIRLEERAAGRDARLLQLNLLANASNVDTAGAYARLAPLRRHANIQKVDPTLLAAELTRLRKQHPNDVGAWLSAVKLTVMGAPTAAAADAVQEALRDSILPNLPGAAAYLVDLDDRLPFRAAALRGLLYIADGGSGPPQQTEDGITFRSAIGLTGDLNLGLHAYLAPLFLSAAPWVWGFTAARAGGVVAFLFGEAIAGRRGESAEPLHLFAPTSSRDFPPPRPSTGIREQAAALAWWVRQLDRLLTEVLDPANHAPDGILDVEHAFAVHLSTEQLFRAVQSLSVHDRDAIARRTMMFDALDTLQGLTGISFDTRCRLAHARRVLDDVQAALPTDVASVLIPRAERAVKALQELQEGFFLPSRVSDSSIRVPDKTGSEQEVPLESAVASWLRVLRNAGHGFGSKPSKKGRDDVLLRAHDGVVPADLPDLPYLYLVELLAFPERLRRFG
jgi:hypothetical protein